MHKDNDRFCTLTVHAAVDSHLRTTQPHIKQKLFLIIKFQDMIYSTVTAEKAAKHIVAIKIRKWPHREKFSTSSSCCMNL